MKIAIGNDHAGVELKQVILKALEDKGVECVNCGTDTTQSIDYPVIAERVCKKVLSGECEKGILICGTGIGISIAANKIKGIRCALCTDPVMATLSRQHNNANVLSMGARIVGSVLAEGIVEAFLNTEFLGGRHANRLKLVSELEEKGIIE